MFNTAVIDVEKALLPRKIWKHISNVHMTKFDTIVTSVTNTFSPILFSTGIFKMYTRKYHTIVISVPKIVFDKIVIDV